MAERTRQHTARRTSRGPASVGLARTLQDEFDWLRRAQRISRVGAWELDVLTGEVTVSDEMLDLFGIERSVLAFGGETALLAAIHPDDQAHVRDSLQRLTVTGSVATIRFRVVRPVDEQVLWFAARAGSELDAAGRPRRVTCTVTDISELAQAEEELRDAHAELGRAHAELLQANGYQHAVIATTPDAIHVYDVMSRTFTRANRTGAPLIGYTPEAVRVMSGQDVALLVPAEDYLRLEETLRESATLEDQQVAHLRHRIVHPDGTTSWLGRRMSVFARDGAGRATSLVVVSRDVTEVVEVEQRLHHAANHDDLTGLPNRRLVLSTLAGRLAARPGRTAVLIVDLDGFKRINDANGHCVGDQVLIAAARRLTAVTRGGDVVARLGGDEFVLLLDVPDAVVPETLAEEVARRVEATLTTAFALDGNDYALTASIGICVPGPGATPESALSDADAAMYAVKKRGANGHSLFDPALQQEARALERIERLLRRALKDDAIEVHYQPIVAPVTGAVVSVEALVRLRDEAGVPVDAAAVVAVAERCGLVGELDDQVLRKACEQVARWRREPQYADLRLALNRSAKDITRPGFSERVLTLLQRTDLPPDALTLEITETVLLDVAEDGLADVLLLRDRSVRLAIDDFGTGYASMSQLAKLPISSIKIDRTFTSKMLHDRTCSALVRATIGIAAELGLSCVVEGVETVDQLQALPRYENLFVQGYLYGRPRRAEDGLGVTSLRL